MRPQVRDRYGEEFPEASEEFSLDQLPGAYEGDWPALPTEKMAKWLPDTILKLGIRTPTLFGAELLKIDPCRRGQVVVRLRRLGLRCREDDELISRACGAWRYA